MLSRHRNRHPKYQPDGRAPQNTNRNLPDFLTRAAINVIAAPRIFWHFLEQLIPASGSGDRFGAEQPMPPTLAQSMEKSIHTLVQLQLFLIAWTSA